MSIIATLKTALAFAWAYFTKPEIKSLIELLKLAAAAFERGEKPEGMGKVIYPLLPEKRYGILPGKDTATPQEVEIHGENLHAGFIIAIKTYHSHLDLYTVGEAKPIGEEVVKEKDSILSKIPLLGWLSRNKDKV